MIRRTQLFSKKLNQIIIKYLKIIEFFKNVNKILRKEKIISKNFVAISNKELFFSHF